MMADPSSALTKADNLDLMERYKTVCERCGWDRQFFGTEKEARESALKMGWEFRPSHDVNVETLKAALGHPDALRHPGLVTERAYCPHCQLLVKA